MAKKLEVKNLRISFKTANGKVQAVRDISFDLHQGETLAVVGESGSGKSVTSKSILGILAGNAIVEGGEIIYDGRDLLKISEEEFCRIRGDKIAMIFQDPMSSLNPIMRIGKQLTEAMILKGKARQRASKIAFNNTLKLLEETMVTAIAKGEYEKISGLMPVKAKTENEIRTACKNFNAFEFKHTELEQAYNEAKEAAEEAIPYIKEITFLIEKKSLEGIKDKIDDVLSLAGKTYNDYFVKEDAEKLAELIQAIKKDLSKKIKAGDLAEVSANLTNIVGILEAAQKKDEPNFFRMGYYLQFSDKPLPNMTIAALNEYLLKYLDDNFMREFLSDAEIALRYSARIYAEKKKAVLALLEQANFVFAPEALDKKAVMDYAKRLIEAVEDSIDHLEINKDNIAYTFGTSLLHAIDSYFQAIPRNKAVQKVHDKQQKKYDRLVASGKTPEWKVVPAALIDLDVAKQDILNIIERLRAHYEIVVKTFTRREFEKETVALIDDLKTNASGIVYKVTKAMAKHRAIKLMEEVGIANPRKRFRQYPFEFSGGMRQRIVIAVALAANPDILICDEPTTALDVTIQAQILELINKIKEQRKLSIIFITHDLGVVANMADRIAVMYAGKIVECGTSEDVFYRPAHPYTWALLSSMPDLDTNERLEAIPGTPPNMIYPPEGDAFAERNKYALEIDYELQPPMFRISETHSAATWLLHENAPKVDPPKIVTERIQRMRERGGEQ